MRNRQSWDQRSPLQLPDTVADAARRHSPTPFSPPTPRPVRPLPPLHPGRRPLSNRVASHPATRPPPISTAVAVPEGAHAQPVLNASADVDTFSPPELLYKPAQIAELAPTLQKRKMSVGKRKPNLSSKQTPRKPDARKRKEVAVRNLSKPFSASGDLDGQKKCLSPTPVHGKSLQALQPERKDGYKQASRAKISSTTRRKNKADTEFEVGESPADTKPLQSPIVQLQPEMRSSKRPRLRRSRASPPTTEGVMNASQVSPSLSSSSRLGSPEVIVVPSGEERRSGEMAADPIRVQGGINLNRRVPSSHLNSQAGEEQQLSWVAHKEQSGTAGPPGKAKEGRLSNNESSDDLKGINRSSNGESSGDLEAINRKRKSSTSSLEELAAQSVDKGGERLSSKDSEDNAQSHENVFPRPIKVATARGRKSTSRSRKPSEGTDDSIPVSKTKESSSSSTAKANEGAPWLLENAKNALDRPAQVSRKAPSELLDGYNDPKRLTRLLASSLVIEEARCVPRRDLNRCRRLGPCKTVSRASQKHSLVHNERRLRFKGISRRLLEGAKSHGQEEITLQRKECSSVQDPNSRSSSPSKKVRTSNALSKMQCAHDRSVRDVSIPSQPLEVSADAGIESSDDLLEMFIGTMSPSKRLHEKEMIDIDSFMPECEIQEKDDISSPQGRKTNGPDRLVEKEKNVCSVLQPSSIIAAQQSGPVDSSKGHGAVPHVQDPLSLSISAKVRNESISATQQPSIANATEREAQYAVGGNHPRAPGATGVGEVGQETTPDNQLAISQRQTPAIAPISSTRQEKCTNHNSRLGGDLHGCASTVKASTDREPSDQGVQSSIVRESHGFKVSKERSVFAIGDVLQRASLLPEAAVPDVCWDHSALSKLRDIMGLLGIEVEMDQNSIGKPKVTICPVLLSQGEQLSDFPGIQRPRQAPSLDQMGTHPPAGDGNETSQESSRRLLNTLHSVAMLQR
ncbi:unnamed protein product [Chondrus crispus]|uniref:Uncharacterized protein n=1 Tax=Chondrus crispus TaxID=2769 RepID=R7QCK6_CHOCR|nr:unnamed protein product [Chondrus crispus]CDF36247.1 unnamed protein product [Chondrus crispus]|eukprot:XP_005716066.1 unnamed protein product [Chondrus crispus]